MARLFVAIDLPESARQALAAIQPAPAPGIRLVREDQMHLTLHFIGPAESAHISIRLQNIGGQPLPLRIRSAGSFRSAGRSATLWAGVENVSALASLHKTLAIALQGAGIQPDAREYHPHITLARCGPNVPKSIIERFRNENKFFELPAFQVSTFTLYSSELNSDDPSYRIEQTFSLDQ